MSEEKPVDQLEPDDRYMQGEVEVVILGREPDKNDRFGRPTIRYMAKRMDTGAEGLVFFGYGAKPRAIHQAGECPQWDIRSEQSPALHVKVVNPDTTAMQATVWPLNPHAVQRPSLRYTVDPFHAVVFPHDAHRHTHPTLVWLRRYAPLTYRLALVEHALAWWWLVPAHHTRVEQSFEQYHKAPGDMPGAFLVPKQERKATHAHCNQDPGPWQFPW